MTVSSGFFNSVNHDRMYNSEQISSIFDGIINDGIFSSVGTAFRVSSNPDINDSVLVGTGRAWFDHVWILNDAQFSLTLSPPTLVGSRIDSVVIDVDRRDSVRACSIIVVEGSVSTSASPSPPSLINEERHKQYRIANITIPAGSSSIISASNISYVVGRDETPIVTGPLEVVNSDNFFDQMESELEDFKNDAQNDFNIWFNSIKDFIEDLQIGNINLATSIDNVTIEWSASTPEGNDYKLRVKDGGITRDKLSPDLLAILGILDTSDWNYDQYYSYVSSLTSSSEEDAFMGKYFTSGSASSWTINQIVEFYGILKSNSSKEKLWSEINFSSLSLSELKLVAETFGSSKYPSFVGKTVSINIASYGDHTFRVIGINHDDLTSGGKALMTLQSTDIVADCALGSDILSKKYSASDVAVFTDNLLSLFDSDTQLLVKQVIKKELNVGSSSSSTTFNASVWLASWKELGINMNNNNLGTSYDYWSGKGDSRPGSSEYSFKKDGTASKWWCRDILYSGYSKGLCYINEQGHFCWKDTGANIYHQYASSRSSDSFGIVPCFCV